MAEAAAGGTLNRALSNVRGDFSLIASEEGTYSITLSFNPFRFKKHVMRIIFRMRKAVENSIWPLTPGICGGTCAAVAIRVLTAPQDSWWRSGSLAHLLWQWDNLFPWEKNLPTNVRVAWLSLLAGSIGLCGISFVQRTMLRMLLNYQGWMWLEHGQKPSILQKLWFVIVKVLSGGKPSLYNFQACLPTLPVAPLKSTCNKYLLSVKPLLSDDEYKTMEGHCKKFLANEGWKLQLFLQIRTLYTSSWLWDWWEKYVYLRGRAPIMVNSNYYIMDPLHTIICTNQAARAASLINESFKFKSLVDWETLDPVRLQKTIPWCMKQYERIFDTTRLPGKECDQIVHSEEVQKYVAVCRRGVWYQLYMSTRVGGEGGKMRPLKLHEIEQQIEYIIADADKNPAKDNECLAALTGWNRTRWAEAREEFFWEGVNKKSLRMIEKASFVMILEHRTPADKQAMAKTLIHGDGKTVWFDKSFNFFVFPDGKAGLNAEHSYADALTVAHMWEWVMTGERKESFEDKAREKNNHVVGYTEAMKNPPKVRISLPKRVVFELQDEAKKIIAEAYQANLTVLNDLDLDVLEFSDYGKGFMKKARISPDAYAQMVMQLSYYRDAGKFALTYEASVTRLFCMGRTETVRSLSVESRNFVETMLDPKATTKQKVDAMRAGEKKHTQLYKQAMTGGGVDRHLFGLYVASVGLGYDSEFLKSALKMPWTLSTSQTPQKQTNRWNPDKEDAIYVSPGGGFGPVADDGYGVSYMFPNDKEIFFHVSSKKSTGVTDTQRFIKNIKQSLADVKKVFEAHIADVEAEKAKKGK
mmetsp:Transcript_854/g.2270  ORF Transcript_854/g.2270 Transcript_854/m.2270 type:complete len:809 (+) Transcript_854:119-2545(+)|eukprot:CAMPEP_0173463082 /NCGR_PEP_ID=MMETSP1357-20121228/67762_1 /TAXON_ID=77926 /ORGANISM="Hemiselmis rufescens, Strain PCC563" /LENGTH=808 /DNA_ID=CAMNT_0014430869 /DNA_START=93 /DNA_END=2519 /DNA_ORIENTATION=+